METQVLDLLWRRKATRAIAARPVEPEKVEVILEAARLSASCANKQPWRFLVLDEPEALEKGRQALSRGNYWAKMAPVLIVGYSKPDLDCILSDGRRYYQFDLGMAVQNILLQAAELDLVARPMAGYSPQKVKEMFDIPDEFEVMVFIAIGYEGDISTLEERHQRISRDPRQRRPLEEVVNFNRLTER
ncbi:MAG: nitroreductase family protein [Chloroflexota bacterium]|nr:nitroreductase family protein [Chloroflexota bacterium]